MCIRDSYTTEKSLKDFGGKISEAERKGIEEKLNNLKEIIKRSDATKEEIQKAMDELTQASYKLAEEVYKASTEKRSQAGGSQTQEKEKESHDGEVIDADYKEDKDNK